MFLSEKDRVWRGLDSEEKLKRLETSAKAPMPESVVRRVFAGKAAPKDEREGKEHGDDIR